MNKNQKYIDIIESTCLDYYKEKYIIAKSDDDDERLHILSTVYDRYSLFTFLTKDGNFMINLPFFYDDNDNNYHRQPIEIPTDSIDLFKELLKVIIDKKISPSLIMAYKSGVLNTLPDVLNNHMETLDLSKITIEIFEKFFNESTMEESNHERIEDTQLSLIDDKTIEFKFNIDCGRQGVHKSNYAVINNRGLIQVELCELLEGGGIETALTDKIKEFFKTNI